MALLRRHALLLVVALVVASTATFVLGTATPGAAFCSAAVQDPFDCDRDADGHEPITWDGLRDFLNQCAIGEMNDEHAFIDTLA